MTDPNQPNEYPQQPGQYGPPGERPVDQPGQYGQPPVGYGQPAYPPAGQHSPSGQYPNESGQYPPPPGQYPPAPGQYPPPGYGYPPAAPAKRKTGKILAIVGGVLVVLIVAAVVIATLVNKHSDKLAKAHTLTVPAAAGSYVQQTNDNANKVGDSILTAVKDQDSVGVWTNPKVGVYGKDANGAPEVILLGLNVADSKELTREMGTNSLEDESKRILKSAGLDDAQSYPAGTFGGVLKCGTLDEGTDKLATCIWVDHSTVGVVYQIDGTPDSAAVVAKDIREAGEK